MWPPWTRTDPPPPPTPPHPTPCGTHPDADQRGARGRVLRQADVVHGLAEDGPVVVLVDEVDEDAGEAHVVRHGLIGVELGKRRYVLCEAGWVPCSRGYRLDRTR